MINLDRLKGFGLGIPDCQNYGNFKVFIQVNNSDLHS